MFANFWCFTGNFAFVPGNIGDMESFSHMQKIPHLCGFRQFTEIRRHQQSPNQKILVTPLKPLFYRAGKGLSPMYPKNIY